MPDIAEGRKDISFYPFVFTVQIAKQVTYRLPFGGSGKWARIVRGMQAKVLTKACHLFFVQKGKWANNSKVAVEEWLAGNHGADIAAIEQVDKKGFNDIFFVVTQG